MNSELELPNLGFFYSKIKFLDKEEELYQVSTDNQERGTEWGKRVKYYFFKSVIRTQKTKFLFGKKLINTLGHNQF